MTEDENNRAFAKHDLHPKKISYEFEWTCCSCGRNFFKKRSELTKLQPKNLKFINRSKYAKKKSNDVVKTYIKVMKLKFSMNFLKCYQD